MDVQIVGVYQYEGEDGTVESVGLGEADGHLAVFSDDNGDGVVDTVMIDVNDNADFEDNEIFNAGNSGITVDQIIQDANEGLDDLGDQPISDDVDMNLDGSNDQFFSEMPDYTNDADTSSLC